MTLGISTANALRALDRSAGNPARPDRANATPARSDADRPEATDRGQDGAERVEQAVQAGGGQPLGGAPAGAPAPGGGTTRGATAESASSSSSAEVDARLQADLRAAAAGGDRKAAREIARREAAELGEGPEKLQAIEAGVDVWV